MTDTPAQPVSFLAHIPDIKTAFQADCDVVRVTFEIPKEYRSEAMKLADMFGRVLEIAVREH